MDAYDSFFSGASLLPKKKMIRPAFYAKPQTSSERSSNDDRDRNKSLVSKKKK
jgi:hypothetical protein